MMLNWRGHAAVTNRMTPPVSNFIAGKQIMTYQTDSILRELHER